MKTWIVLFRGVNVGGNRKLPMAALRKALAAAGFEDVQSYIQSGNVTLCSDKSARAIETSIRKLVEAEFGFDAPVFAYDPAFIEDAVASSCFPQDGDPSRLHLFFDMPEVGRPDLSDLKPASGDKAVIREGEGVVYLETPDGMSNSKLAENLSRRLKDRTTARNLRTCLKLLDMVGHGAA